MVEILVRIPIAEVFRFDELQSFTRSRAGPAWCSIGRPGKRRALSNVGTDPVPFTFELALMKIFFHAFLVLFFSGFAPARAAEPVASVNAILNGMVHMTDAKCTANRGAMVREAEGKGDLLNAYQAEQAEKTLCDCIPARAKAIQARLSKTQRAEKMSESVFSRKYMPEIMDHCSGEQLQSTFAGACAERYAKLVPESAKFCSCMVMFTSRLSGAQAAQLGGEAADYAPLASAASKSGAAAPTPPPLLKSMIDAQSTCARP